MKEIGAGSEEVSSFTCGVEAVVEEGPLVAGLKDAGIGSENFVPGTGGAVGNDGISRVPLPGFEIGGRGDAGLFVPALAGVLGVIEEIERAFVLDQARFVETAALPFGTVVWMEDGRIDLPVHEVGAPAKADDGSALFVAGVWVGMISAEVPAFHLLQFAFGPDVVFANDPVHGDVEAGDGGIGIAGENAAEFLPIGEVVR